MAKKQPATVPAVSVETETANDLQFIREAGKAVAELLARAKRFLTEGNEMEARAAATLARFETFKAPTSGAEDEKIQLELKQANADEKTIETFWQPVCSMLFKFHRLTTTRRDRGIKLLADAKVIGNNLHNGWTAAERKRAADEAERRRIAAEAQARADRDRDLDRLEAEAVRAEDRAPDVSAREAAFVAHYVQHNNATRAAEVAGFRDPEKSAVRLLGTSKIQKAMQARRDAVAIRSQASAIQQMPLDVKPIEQVKPDIRKAEGAHDRDSHKAELLDARTLIEAAFAIDGQAISAAIEREIAATPELAESLASVALHGRLVGAIGAVLKDNKYGIPRDVLVVNETRLNQYAKDLKELISKWPGVRYKKTTSLIGS